MENLTPKESPNLIIFDDLCFIQLDVARKWAKFLSIVGFVFLTAMALFSVFMLSQFFYGGIRFQIMAIFPMILLGAVYFFPIYFLSRFSYYSKRALDTFSGESLAIALRYLKLHYAYMGILLIIILISYLFAFIMMFTMSDVVFFDFFKTTPVY
jgi:hypothetical protein